MSRRSFAPVVLVGLASAGLTALAGHKPWLGLGSGGVMADASGLARPEVGAVGLVALAAWGVVLVTRGRIRRGVAALAALAGLAAVVLAVHGLLDDTVGDVGWFSYDARPPTPHRTAWGWLATAGALLTTLAALGALRWAPGWPEMGRKYDAPAGPDTTPPPGERSELDLWKALDHGEDPTAHQPTERPE